MEENNNKVSNFFGDAIILAAIVGLGYLITSFVTSSYLEYFGISLSFSLRQPSTTELILATFSVIVASVVCLILSIEIYKLLTKGRLERENTIFYLWSIFLSYFIPFILIEIFMLGGVSLSLFLKWVSVLLIFFGLVLALKFLARVRGGKKEEKLKKEKSLLDYLFLTSHLDPFIKKDYKKTSLVIIIIIGFWFMMVLSRDFGTGIAKQKDFFNVINGTPILVEIVQYEDFIVAMEFDQDRMVLLDPVHIVNVNSLEERGLYMSRQKIGPFESRDSSKSFWDKLAERINN
ncbi:MAG: hypothetical protein Q7R86_01010 [bacterium]|nr:hypothetical protein [bacterium]